MNRSEFIEYIKPTLKAHNITLVCVDAAEVEGTGGYFHEGLKKIAVAMKHKDSFGLLVHEYSHFEQWLNKPAFWDKVSPGHAKFFNWMDTPNPVNREVIRWKEAALTLEHDCETRSLHLIESLGLEIDKKRYAQKANAYLLSYHLILTYKKWPEGCVYSDKISSHMKTKLLSLSQAKNTKSLKGEALRLMDKAFVTTQPQKCKT